MCATTVSFPFESFFALPHVRRVNTRILTKEFHVSFHSLVVGRQYSSRTSSKFIRSTLDLNLLEATDQRIAAKNLGKDTWKRIVKKSQHFCTKTTLRCEKYRIFTHFCAFYLPQKYAYSCVFYVVCAVHVHDNCSSFSQSVSHDAC